MKVSVVNNANCQHSKVVCPSDVMLQSNGRYIERLTSELASD